MHILGVEHWQWESSPSSLHWINQPELRQNTLQNVLVAALVHHKAALCYNQVVYVDKADSPLTAVYTERKLEGPWESWPDKTH